MSNPLGPLYSFQFVFLVICAAAYYKAADFEDASPILWSGLSVFTFAFTWLFLHWSYPGNFFGQLLLFIGIILRRVYQDRDRS